MAGKYFIQLSTPHMSREGYELDYVREAFETNWIAPLGANVDGFEAELCKKVGAAHGAALVTGTAALHLALRAAGVGAGDVVFCQSLTFAASANPIVYLGARPVFIDSDPGTWNMDPGALEEAFRRWRPKAVVAVHLYGLSADIDPIWSFAARTARRSSRTRPKASGRRTRDGTRARSATTACTPSTATRSSRPPAGAWSSRKTPSGSKRSVSGPRRPKIRRGITSTASSATITG
jgi:hypothetical protein